MSEIAIVGIGALFPGAADARSFWSNICAGVDAISQVPPSRWDDEAYYDSDAYNQPPSGDRFYCRRGGFIDDLATFDPLPFGIMPAAVEGTEPDQLLALRTAAEAIADAGGESALPDRSRIGVVIGRGGYITPGSARLDQRVRTAHQLTSVISELFPDASPEQLGRVREAFQEQLGPLNPESSIGIVPNFAASRIANRFDFHGPAYTVDAACASSLVAVDSAVRELESGRCDLVLAGGVHHCHLATLWSVFTQLRALSRSEQIRPFDSRADGTLMSEGTGIVALKRLEDARRQDDRIYAVIRGVGLASDGRASSLMSPRVEGQVLAIERAWSMTGLDPAAAESVGLIEAHGTATPAGDRTEIESLRRVFGSLNGHRPAGIGTVKSMIGHAMPAAGVAGLIKAALALHHEVLPPTLHIEEPRPELNETRFRPVVVTEPWESDGPRRAGLNAFGFGGINAHVVLEEAEPRSSKHRAHPLPAAPEPMLLLAGTAQEILASLDRPGGTGVLPHGGPCRLAVVDPDERKLALARKIVARGTPWRGRTDIWFTPTPLIPAGGKIAMVFPGIVAEFDPQLEGIASLFGLPAPALTLSRRTADHARDVMKAGLFLYRVLAELGVEPDVIGGHSLGEWTAMIASGICPPEALDTFAVLLEPMEVEAPPNKHAALGCPTERVNGELAGIPEVWVTHDNCPHQTVVCGRPEGVDELVARLSKEGIITQELPFELPFHTPALLPFLEESRRVYARLPLSLPRYPMWSATSVAPYPATREPVLDLVFRHLVEKVRYTELIGRLYEEGVRVFIEVGPGNLTGFIEDSLRGRELLTTSAGASGKPGLGQLCRTAAALWAEGADVDIARLLPAVTRPVALDLGSPMVKLNGAAAPLRAAIAGRVAPLVQKMPDHPVLAELEALLSEAGLAAQAVTDAWRSTTALSSLEIEREFSLRTMPYLVDHCLIDQPDDWPDPSDRLPVVPMTTLLEVMAEAASRLQPGKVAIGFRDIQARRWLVAEPATTLSVKAELDGPGRVKVALGEHAAGIVLMADGYPQPPTPAPAALTGPRPAPVSARQLYADRWMFHGPLFAGVTAVHTLAEDGLTGEIEALPTPGATLDSAGQLIGHWAQAALDTDRTVFPTGIDSVTLFAPLPVGERLECSVHVDSLTEHQMRSTAELTTAHGTVWGRIEGWTTRRFSTNQRIWAVKTSPETSMLSEVQPGGWLLMGEGWHDVATRNLMMYRYLNAAERAEYEMQNPRRQQEWLLGRIAAKDAVRDWLWRNGHGPLYPCEVKISNEPSGKPIARGDFIAPEISIAHKKGVAVAMASDAPVGIDVESDTLPEAPDVMFTPAEQTLLAGLPAGWPARFWSAKEAAAKAAGTGLMGRPRSFEVAEIDGETLTVRSTCTSVVATRMLQDGGHVVAWTETGGCDEQT